MKTVTLYLPDETDSIQVKIEDSGTGTQEAALDVWAMPDDRGEIVFDEDSWRPQNE